MMCRIINQSHGHDIKNLKIPLKGEFSCLACSKEKLVTRPSKLKVANETPSFFRESEISMDYSIPLVDHFGTLWY